LHCIVQIESFLCQNIISGVHWTLAAVQLQCMLAALHMSSPK